MSPMKLRLYHHHDGTRVAYRESGTGPGLMLLHSALLNHREFEPIVEHLTHRFRLVLPDLPLHGDSEDRPRHPYTPEWFCEVMSAFCHETCGPRPLVGGHGIGAELLVRSVATRRLTPQRLVLMPNRMHCNEADTRRRGAWRVAARAASLPVLDRALTHAAARAVFRPDFGMTLTARSNPAARDLFRHAFADVGGNATLAHAWAKFARHWPAAPQTQLLDAYPHLDVSTLLLWADSDRMHPLAIAEAALQRLPDADLRVLTGTGFLIAYDDPIGVARELTAFCG